MPVLDNPRHEKYCQLRQSGLTIDKAYEQAGFKKNRSNASQLNAKQHIQKRMKELAEAVADVAIKELGFDMADALRELGKLGFSNISDYGHVNADGTMSIDLTACTRDQFAAITEVQTETLYVRKGEDQVPLVKVKLKIADKHKSLVDIIRHFGGFVDRHEHTGRDGEPLESGPIDHMALARTILGIFSSAELSEEDANDAADVADILH